jgi:hypothetical protein
MALRGAANLIGRDAKHGRVYSGVYGMGDKLTLSPSLSHRMGEGARRSTDATTPSDQVFGVLAILRDPR